MSDIRRLNGQFSSLPIILGNQVDEALHNRIGPKMLQFAREHTPVSGREGYNRARYGAPAAERWSLKKGGSFSSGRATLDLKNDAPYMYNIIHGRNPGVISGNPYMYFRGLADNQLVRTRFVDHPGYEANPFLQNAIEQNERLILTEIDASIKIALAKVFV